MAVLVEAISVVVRLDAIDARFVGGWAAFLASAPNRTLCADADLARVGFMAPQDVLAYVTELEAGGLVCLCKGEAQDLAVLDQLHGPTVNAPWLDFGTIDVDEFKGRVGACRLLGSIDEQVAAPIGWKFQGSMSERGGIVANEDADGRMKFLRADNSVDVFLDKSTGEEVYLGRTSREH